MVRKYLRGVKYLAKGGLMGIFVDIFRWCNFILILTLCEGGHERDRSVEVCLT